MNYLVVICLFAQFLRKPERRQVDLDHRNFKQEIHYYSAVATPFAKLSKPSCHCCYYRLMADLNITIEFSPKVLFLASSSL